MLKHLKKYILFVFLGILSTQVFSANNTLKAFFSYAVFHNPAAGSYIETYLSIDGNTIHYVKNKNSDTLIAAVQITYTFSQDDKIVQSKKYNLISPSYTDSNATKKDFLDLQRFSLPEGNYEMKVSIRDTNTNQQASNYKKELSIHFTDKKIQFSDVEFISSIEKSTSDSRFDKNGYRIEPFALNFFTTHLDKLGFYVELYNTQRILGKGQDFLIKYYIKDYDKDEIIEKYGGFSREKAKEVNVLSGFMPIKELESGNYNLVFEARDRENKILTQKSIFFQRLNTAITPEVKLKDYQNSFVSKMTKDSLRKFIASLWPISSDLEQNFVQNQLKIASLEVMQQYFLHFWLKRDKKSPGNAWDKYHKDVLKVNRKYSTSITKGYKTERGRVYLEYGKPDVITEQKHNPSAYPYEIWQYYKTKQYSNRKFVFYETDIGTNIYRLLYSDVPGEISQPQWKRKLFKRTTITTDPYNESIDENYGNHVNDYFNQPR